MVCLGGILESFGVTGGHDGDFWEVLMLILEHFRVLLARLLKSWGGLGVSLGPWVMPWGPWGSFFGPQSKIVTFTNYI